MSDITIPGQNWLITPAADLTHPVAHPPPPGQSASGSTQATQDPAAPPAIIFQKWLLVLSGVAVVGVQGTSTSDWFHETLLLNPDTDAPLNFALSSFSIPKPKPTPADTNPATYFQVEQWSPFATINSIFDQNQSINAGFAVDDWRPNPFRTVPDAVTSQELSNIWNGLLVDVAVRDSDATLFRVGYNITLLGKIVFGGAFIQ